MKTIFYLILTIIIVFGMLYYINKATIYKSDERGRFILYKSSNIVFGTILIIFSLFTLYPILVDILKINSSFEIDDIRNVGALIMATLSSVNVFAIMYYEKKM